MQHGGNICIIFKWLTITVCTVLTSESWWWGFQIVIFEIWNVKGWQSKLDYPKFDYPMHSCISRSNDHCTPIATRRPTNWTAEAQCCLAAPHAWTWTSKTKQPPPRTERPDRRCRLLCEIARASASLTRALSLSLTQVWNFLLPSNTCAKRPRACATSGTDLLDLLVLNRPEILLANVYVSIRDCECVYFSKKGPFRSHSWVRAGVDKGNEWFNDPMVNSSSEAWRSNSNIGKFSASMHRRQAEGSLL